ncbi:MAG: AraC family transcriptional regulator [Pseudoflavonifractor sp.]
MPYFGTRPERQTIKTYQIATGYLYTIALNECLHNHPEVNTRAILEQCDVVLNTNLEEFYFCLTGLKKDIYFSVYGYDAGDYLEIYEVIRQQVEAELEHCGYLADVFMVMEEDAKQMAILFSPKPSVTCSPQALAQRLSDLAQQVYEELIFKGDKRYCNVTALSAPLSGFGQIRAGYLQVRQLNDLSFFHMEPEVITAERVAALGNGADYLAVIEGCVQVCAGLDEGDAPQVRRQLEGLFLDLLRKSYSRSLCRDALSFCKNMLQVRGTVYDLLGEMDLESLCEIDRYLRIEECVRALGAAMDQVCEAVRRQGSYAKPVLLAICFIKNHYREDLSLPDVAKYAGVNPNYLSGVFRENTGVPLRDYITAVRLGAAKTMLAEGNRKISEIAEGLGFYDAKYFTRIFKKAEGITPAEYRAGR